MAKAQTQTPSAEPWDSMQSAVADVPQETRVSKYETGPLAQALRGIPEGKAVTLSFPYTVWHTQQAKTESGNTMDRITNAIRQTALAVRPSKTLSIKRQINQAENVVTFTVWWRDKIRRPGTGSASN